MSVGRGAIFRAVENQKHLLYGLQNSSLEKPWYVSSDGYGLQSIENGIQ
jgi:hypothetical protein